MQNKLCTHLQLGIANNIGKYTAQLKSDFLFNVFIVATVAHINVAFPPSEPLPQVNVFFLSLAIFL